jgi:predicted transposase YdaD
LIEDAYSEGEEKKALSIARSMKTKGFDTPTIAELTGLSPELIERL